MTEHEIDFETTAVQQHINILQDIIARLAQNSNSCKKWCLAITTAIFTLFASNKQIIHYCYFYIYIIIGLHILDTYYLSMERAFRKKYEKFIEKLHSNELQITDLYNLKFEDITFCQKIENFFSTSVLLFYIPIILLFILLRYSNV